MSGREKRAGLGTGLYVMASVLLCLYFAFASVQGDFGLLRRIEITAEAAELQTRLADLETEVATYENLTRRLSDDYLDLDLLDEQARDILGYVRADEVVVQ